MIYKRKEVKLKDSDFNKKLSKFILSYRNENKMSQEAFAEDVGITARTLGKIERRESDARASTIVKIFKAVGQKKTVEFIFGEDECK